MVNMQLHENWRDLLKRAWSVRLMALSAVLSGAVAGLTIAQPYLGANPILVASIVAVGSIAASLLGIFARLVKQGPPDAAI